MATAPESNKAKIARRVLEVFEFFDERNRHATVMDIARRYGRPQSSTSELLASLVEMGFLYKDSCSRSFTPTPRVAILGSSAQPDVVRNGSLFMLMDRLSEKTGHGVALLGMVGTQVQIFRWVEGNVSLAGGFSCGQSENLSDSTAGLLLLSTLDTQQSRGLLRRLNAMAAADRKFNPTELVQRVELYGHRRCAIGAAGFVPNTEICVALLRHEPDERPLAVGIVYEAGSSADPDSLLDDLNSSIDRVLRTAEYHAVAA